MTDRDRVAGACRALRAMRDLTQEQMARRVGVSDTTLRQIERGELLTAHQHILAIANSSGVTVEEFETICQLVEAADRRLEALGIGSTS